MVSLDWGNSETGSCARIRYLIDALLDSVENVGLGTRT